MVVYWEWKDDLGAWVSYAKTDSDMLEHFHSMGVLTFKTTKLTFNAGYDTIYEFDLKGMVQHNLSSSKTRQLRRVAAESVGDDEGFSRALSHMVTAVPKKKPGAGSDTEDDGIDDGHPPPPTKVHKPEVPKTEVPVAAPVPVSVVAPLPPPPPPAPAPTTMTAASVVAGWGTTATAPAPVVAAAPVAAPLAPAAAPAPPPPPPPTSAELASASIASAIAVDPSLCAAQVAKGPQSLRKQAQDLGPAGKDPHGRSCFEKMLHREKHLCGEFAVFYHSYSFAALLYEVQAAVAAVLFRFKSEYATLPRLLKAPFNDIPDAPTLQAEFPKMKSRDHDPRFRAVGISVSTSLLGTDPEATPSHVFLHGYSCADLSFVGVLENLLVSCGVPAADKTKLAQQIISLSSKHGLDVSQFKGPPCKSGRAGHLLQIFIKRTIVNRYAYSALPFGVTDKTRPDLAAWLEGNGPIKGQARIVPNPSIFMRGNAVRMYVYSADPTFHTNRGTFQQELTKMLEPIIGAPDVRVKAAQGIYAGVLPPWFVSDDYEQQQKKKAGVS